MQLIVLKNVEFDFFFCQIIAGKKGYPCITILSLPEMTSNFQQKFWHKKNWSNGSVIVGILGLV